jgi:hypothetical protein
MNPKDIKTIIDVAIEQIGYPLIYITAAAFVFFALQGYVKERLLYFAIKFDEVGVGVILLIDNEQYRVHKIRRNYVQLKHLNSDVILRITLKNWYEMNKYMCFNGKPRRRADDPTS